MKFQVPQFIETEEKIVGPFTLKQFFWVGGGAVLIFIVFLTLGLTYMFLFGIPIAALAGALAFLKIQGTPLPRYVLYFLMYAFKGKKYVYRPSDDNQLNNRYGTGTTTTKQNK